MDFLSAGMQKSNNLLLIRRKYLYDLSEYIQNEYIQKVAVVDRWPLAEVQLYSQVTHFYGHPLNTDTSLLRTVCFIPGERKPLRFLYI